jgi:hypothetical protein
MEAVYRKLTGEFVVFSKQYFIDCTFTGSGCAGGTVNEGYKLTKDRQYLMSEEDWPLTTECEYTGTWGLGTRIFGLFIILFLFLIKWQYLLLSDFLLEPNQDQKR